MHGSELIRVRLEDGTVIVAEVDRAELPDVVLASPDGSKVIAEAAETFEVALDRISKAVRTLGNKLCETHSHAMDISVEFGLQVGGEAGLIFAKGSAEASFKVTLAWTKPSGNV